MGIISKIASHLDLMQEMFTQTGAMRNSAVSIDQNSSFRQAISRCAGCDSTKACREWLDFGLEQNLERCAPPRFCPNAGFQLALKETLQHKE